MSSANRAAVKNPLLTDSYAYCSSRHADKHMAYTAVARPVRGSTGTVVTSGGRRRCACSTMATTAATAIKSILVVCDWARAAAMPSAGTASIAGLIGASGCGVTTVCEKARVSPLGFLTNESFLGSYSTMMSRSKMVDAWQQSKTARRR